MEDRWGIWTGVTHMLTCGQLSGVCGWHGDSSAWPHYWATLRCVWVAWGLLNLASLLPMSLFQMNTPADLNDHQTSDRPCPSLKVSGSVFYSVCCHLVIRSRSHPVLPNQTHRVGAKGDHTLGRGRHELRAMVGLTHSLGTVMLVKTHVLEPV